MNMQNTSLGQYLLENLVLFLIFFSVSIAVTWIAYLKRFFHLPFRLFDGPRISIKDVIVSFFVFSAIYMFLGPKVMQILFRFPSLAVNGFTIVSIMQFVLFIMTVICLYVYTLFQDRAEMVKVFKDEAFPGKKSFGGDIFLGVITWVIATPVVISLSQLSEMFTTLLFGKPEAEQIAVESLKNSFLSPFALITVLISILVFAPLLEEYLFRGILQSWLRRKIGSVWAIFITAAAFALLHYNGRQGWTNIPLITSLFALGCYLGFVYEKTRSLFTPIVLHVTFNFISVMRIILTDGN